MATKTIAAIGKFQIPVLHLNHFILSKMSKDRIRDKGYIEELQKIQAIKKVEAAKRIEIKNNTT